ncbi:MAG TPA: hypothetical protein VKT32_03880 [Chthonomonadaceae bacterium]|nr:hypothetical protein [Chthonomonadaceae bacterium]
MSQDTQVVGPIMVTDVTGQKSYRVEKMPSEATIDEVVQRLLGPMQQPTQDPEGRPLAYGVRSDREGRFLGGNERVSDAVQPNDTLRLLPTVDAGRG